MVLISYVISQDQVTKRWNNIMGRSPLLQVSSLPSLVAISTAVVEI